MFTDFDNFPIFANDTVNISSSALFDDNFEPIPQMHDQLDSQPSIFDIPDHANPEVPFLPYDEPACFEAETFLEQEIPPTPPSPVFNTQGFSEPLSQIETSMYFHQSHDTPPLFPDISIPVKELSLPCLKELGEIKPIYHQKRIPSPSPDIFPTCIFPATSHRSVNLIPYSIITPIDRLITVHSRTSIRVAGLVLPSFYSQELHSRNPTYFQFETVSSKIAFQPGYLNIQLHLHDLTSTQAFGVETWKTLGLKFPAATATSSSFMRPSKRPPTHHQHKQSSPQSEIQHTTTEASESKRVRKRKTFGEFVVDDPFARTPSEEDDCETFHTRHSVHIPAEFRSPVCFDHTLLQCTREQPSTTPSTSSAVAPERQVALLLSPAHVYLLNIRPNDIVSIVFVVSHKVLHTVRRTSSITGEPRPASTSLVALTPFAQLTPQSAAFGCTDSPQSSQPSPIAPTHQPHRGLATAVQESSVSGSVDNDDDPFGDESDSSAFESADGSTPPHKSESLPLLSSSIPFSFPPPSNPVPPLSSSSNLSVSPSSSSFTPSFPPAVSFQAPSSPSPTPPPSSTLPFEFSPPSSHSPSDPTHIPPHALYTSAIDTNPLCIIHLFITLRHSPEQKRGFNERGRGPSRFSPFDVEGLLRGRPEAACAQGPTRSAAPPKQHSRASAHSRTPHPKPKAPPIAASPVVLHVILRERLRAFHDAFDGFLHPLAQSNGGTLPFPVFRFGSNHFAISQLQRSTDAVAQ